MSFVVVSVAIGIGCNTLLDNRPGHLDGGVSSEVDDDGGTSSEPSASTPETPESPQAAAADDASSKDAAAPDVSTGCAACALANAVATCDHDGCAILACMPGFGDCDDEPSDGCETPLDSVTSCGACGRSCRAGRHARPSCVAGACIATCETGFGDCDGDPDNGCERNLEKDPHHCGACAIFCLFGHCEAGRCTD